MFERANQQPKSLQRTSTWWKRPRGAAMVEAVVVLPVLIGFLACFKYIKQSYDERMRLQNQMHLQTSRDARAGCTSGGGVGLITGCKGGPNLGLYEASSRGSGNVSVGSTNSNAPGTLSRSIGANGLRLCDEVPVTGFAPKAFAEKAGQLIFDPRVEPGDPTAGRGCEE